MTRRPYDQRLAALLVRPLRDLPISPNAVTASSLIIGLGAAYSFALGERVSTALAGALFMLACLLDHMDGELARLTRRTSRFGHYFDRLTAATVYTTSFLAMGLGARDGWLGAQAGWLGASAGVSIAAIFAIRNQVELRHGRASIGQPAVAGFEIEDLLYLVGPVAWLGGTPWLVAAAGVGAPIYLSITLLRAARGRA